MKNENGAQQVSLAGMAMSRRDAANKKRRKKRIILIVVIAVVVLALIAFLIVRSVLSGGPSLTAREMVQYTYTPDSLCDNVSYYVLGVTTGENATDRMDMLAVLCFDRKREALTFLQVPVATDLGNSADFAVTAIGDVWGRPQSVRWCPTCRAKVAASAAEDGKHTVCGSTLETRTGSSFTNLIEVFNKQYGLPIDNYLVVPRKGLATLIDAVGGLDMTLNKAWNCNGIQYAAGSQTLSGEAAVAYATTADYDGTPQSDLTRMARQRELLAGLLNRLSRYKTGELYNTDPSKADVLSNLMLGRDPVRFDTTSFGKARLLGHSSDRSTDNMKYLKALAEFVHDVSHVPLEKVTCCVLPGEPVRNGTVVTYSVHTAQTIEMLNTHLNPCGLTLDETTVVAPQKSDKQQNEPTVVALNTVLTEQKAPTTTAPATTAAPEEEPDEILEE